MRHRDAKAKHDEAIVLILEERDRQDELKAEGRFKMTLADPMPDAEKLACILEECGEVARNVLARMQLVNDGSTDDDELRKEIVQIAALSLAWVESLIP